MELLPTPLRLLTGVHSYTVYIQRHVGAMLDLKEGDL